MTRVGESREELTLFSNYNYLRWLKAMEGVNWLRG